METGGFTRSEPEGSETTYFISGRDLMPFCLGRDKLVEMPTIDETAVEQIDYEAGDFDGDELYRYTNESARVQSGSEESNQSPDAVHLDTMIDAALMITWNMQVNFHQIPLKCCLQPQQSRIHCISNL